jgi:predicted metal-dependent peptidase
MMDTELERGFSKAKLGIMSRMDSTFISTILFSLKHSWDTKIPTAGTDGIHLIINNDWFMGLTPKQRIGLLAHESWHVAFNHVLRKGDRDHSKFNRAADYVINLLLDDAGYDLPPDGCFDKKYRNMSTEQVYDVLPDEPENPGYEPDIIPNNGSAKQQAARQQAVDDIVVKAATQAKMSGEDPGNLPGDVKRLLDELVNPKLPWRVILQNYMSAFAKDDYTFSKPNRRFMPEFYLPSLHSEAVGEVAIAIDTSASVGKKEFTAFLSEINDIKTTLQPSLTTIIDFDTSIKNVYKLGQDDPMDDVTFTGGGGTCLEPVFEFYKEEPPIVLVIFSDLYCNPIKEDPGYPVVWICVDNTNAKVNFGTKIDYDTSDL